MPCAVQVDPVIVKSDLPALTHGSRTRDEVGHFLLYAHLSFRDSSSSICINRSCSCNACIVRLDSEDFLFFPAALSVSFYGLCSSGSDSSELLSSGGAFACWTALSKALVQTFLWELQLSRVAISLAFASLGIDWR